MEMKHFKKIQQGLLEVWPEHGKFLDKSLAERSDELNSFTEEISEMILPLINDNSQDYFESYKWTCEMLTVEEIHFRRNGLRYRYSTLSEVQSLVYDNQEFMTKYVKGLLLSQVLWTNHINTIYSFSKFLEKSNFESILEIGPGHGLLLALAGKRGVKKINAWDISEHSLAETKKNLDILLPQLEVNYRQVDALTLKSEDLEGVGFDGLVLSEVLEHIEEPQRLVKNIRSTLKKEAKIYINIPVNCPAPDHIYYLDNAKEVVELIEGSGVTVDSFEEHPLSGYKLEVAKKRKMAISVCLVASN